MAKSFAVLQLCSYAGSRVRGFKGLGFMAIGEGIPFSSVSKYGTVCLETLF